MFRAGTCFVLASLLVAASSCSSSNGSTEASSAPEWVDAPAAIDLYEGRSTEVPLKIRVRDPKAVRIEPTATEGITIEVVPEESAGDELFRARLLVRAGYGLSEPSARLAIVDGGTPSTIELPLRPHALSWRSNEWTPSTGPKTREHGVFFLDREAGAGFVFHGSGYSPQFVPIDDSWRLDLATNTWTPWTPTGDVPPATGGVRATLVPGSKTAYVHGGYTGTSGSETARGELYRVDLGRADRQFTKLTGDIDESKRYLHALAYDPKGEQLVVFGGFAGTTSLRPMLDDTWLVKPSGDTATWTKLETTRAPSPRYGAFHAFDEASRRFIVWSGAQAPKSGDPINAAQDAWALDLSATPPAWSKLSPAGEAPPGRRNGCIMHDPVGRRLFVFGGTNDGQTTLEGLWVLSLEPGHEEWTKLEPPGMPPMRSSGIGFALPGGAVACGFGNDTFPFADLNVLGYVD